MQTNSDWLNLTIDDLIGRIEVGVSVQCDDRTKQDGEYGVLKTSSVGTGIFDPSEHKVALPSELSRLRVNPRYGSIVICRSNTPELVGTSAYIENDYPDLFLPDTLWQTTDHNTDAVNIRWLAHYFNGSMFRERIQNIASGTSANMKKISQSNFMKLVIPLPPLAEQHAIAAILSTWDEAITLTTRLIDALKRRKQALMQLLLTGQVRFPGFEGEWEEVEIGDLLTESRTIGSTGAKARKLTVKLYGKGVIPKAETKQGSENTAYYVRKTGQFIYSKLDFLNGAFGIIPSHLDGYETTLDLPAFDVSPLVEAAYLLNYVSREEFYKGFLSGARGGRKAKRIQPTEFLSASIPLPTKQEQSKMAALISLLENYEETVNSSYEAISKQKRGLMQQLLTGAVRVDVRK